MKNFQNTVCAVGITACLFISLFPPLRSPDERYARLKVAGPNNGWFEPVAHISRFFDFRDAVFTQEYGYLRTEIDAGELIRELVLIAVLSVASVLWLPPFVTAMRLSLADQKPKPPV